MLSMYNDGAVDVKCINYFLIKLIVEVLGFYISISITEVTGYYFVLHIVIEIYVNKLNFGHIICITGWS